jgi:hypothetical protein
MSQLALAAMILMLVDLYHHWRFVNIAAIVSFTLMYLYVFGLLIALIAWARRVRQQRKRLELVRRALQPWSDL